MSDNRSPQTTHSEAAKKLAATIVKRANEGVYQRLGVRVAFKPTGLETLIQIYFDEERERERKRCVERIKHWFGGDCIDDRGYECVREIENGG